MPKPKNKTIRKLLKWFKRSLGLRRVAPLSTTRHNNFGGNIYNLNVIKHDTNMIALQQKRIALAEKQIANLENMNGIAEKLIAAKDKQTAEMEHQINCQAVMIKMQEAHAETLKQMALAYAKQFIDIFPKYMMLTRPHLRVPDTFYHEIETLNLQLETGIIDEIAYSAELNRLVVSIADYAG